MPVRKGSKLLIFIITFFAALPPLAIDTYVPAFYQIGAYFNIPTSRVATSVSTYFFGFAVGMLVWGTITDRFGRKKPLICGMFIYIFSSILCSLSVSYQMLLCMRLIQGLGDSCGTIVSMAIIRDCYRGSKLIKTMAIVTMVFMLAPILSPIIGSIIIYKTNHWQDIFHFLTIYGVALLVLSFLIPETLKDDKKTPSILKNISIYIKHFKNISFLTCTLMAGFTFGALFSFISSSSVLIIDYFKLGYIQYCLLFILNTVGVIFASYYVKQRVSSQNKYSILSRGYYLSIIFLTLNLFFSIFDKNIYLFVSINALATGCFVLTNIIITSKALDQLEFGYGSGNAIANLVKFSLGSLASYLISDYSGSELELSIVLQQLGFVSISLILFLLMTKKMQ